MNYKLTGSRERPAPPILQTKIKAKDFVCNRIERVRGGTFHPSQCSYFFTPPRHADVVQWQDSSFPSWQRGFDSRHRLQGICPLMAFLLSPLFLGRVPVESRVLTPLCFFPQQKAVRLGLPPHPLCRHRPMVGHRPSKPGMRVRSPLPAPSPWAGPPVGSPDTSLSLMFGLFLYAAFSRSSGRPTNPGKRKEMIL